MSHSMPAWLIVFNRITGLIVLGGLGWLLVIFGSVWDRWIVALMIVAILISLFMVFAPNKLSLLFGFLKPAMAGVGKWLSQIGKDKVEDAAPVKSKDPPPPAA